jgi:signal recognition particle subunit SEC65
MKEIHIDIPHGSDRKSVADALIRSGYKVITSDKEYPNFDPNISHYILVPVNDICVTNKSEDK